MPPCGERACPALGREAAPKPDNEAYQKTPIAPSILLRAPNTVRPE